MKKKDEKIALSASQTELLLKTLGAAFEEAPESVKDLIRQPQAAKMEKETKKAEKRSEADSGLVF